MSPARAARQLLVLQERPALAGVDDLAPAPPWPRSRPRSAARPAWWGELLVVLFLLVAYDRIADLAQLRVGAADDHARAVLALERALHLAAERPLDHVASAHRHLGQALALYYDLAHGLVTTSLLVAVWARLPAAYRRCRRALVVVGLAALAVFVALPVTPPRLLPRAGVVDVVAQSHTWGAWTSTASVARHADQYAALPSLHVAWAVWVVLAVATLSRRRRWRALSVMHLLVTVAVVLLTGNHYVLDVAAGALLALAAWQVTAGRGSPPGPEVRQPPPGPVATGPSPGRRAERRRA